MSSELNQDNWEKEARDLIRNHVGATMRLMKREYLRGIIDGRGHPLGLDYSLDDLERIYADYLENNPEVAAIDAILDVDK